MESVAGGGVRKARASLELVGDRGGTLCCEKPGIVGAQAEREAASAGLETPFSDF
jgi:hypothetical protein